MTLDLPPIGPAVITLGVFDGVHLGHRHVIAETVRAARARDAAAVALVFDPPPIEVIDPGTKVARLMPVDLVIDWLGAAGADHVARVVFDERLRTLPPEAFLEDVGRTLELRAITMTPDSAFGHRRAGTLERVTEIGREHGFDAIPVEPVAFEGAPVSSTRIRAALAAGDTDTAAFLLGLRPLLRGTVVHGDGRGRDLGFPTANLAFDYTPALPALGIYLGRTTVADRDVDGHPSLVSVGVRPTFEDSGRVLVEVYLLDWEGDLYDTQLTVELGHRLREERRFASVDALIVQMQRDEAHARRLFGD